jgi:hypothetical protein
MRKVQALLLFMSFGAYAFSQHFQTVVSEQWTGAAWNNIFRQTNTFDSSGNVINNLTEFWSNATNAWNVTSQISYTNNSTGKVVMSIGQTYNGSWNAYNRVTNSYSSTGKLQSTLTENVVGINFQNQNQITYTYDSNDFLIQALYQIWDVTSSSWVNSGRITYTNNSSGLETEQIKEVWWNSSWKNSTRTTFTYNSSNKMSLVFGEFWNSNNAWQVTGKGTYSYDANSYLVNFLSENYDDSSSLWQNSAQLNYTNNLNGSLNTVVTQLWNDTNSVWRNYVRNSYTYTDEVTSIKNYSSETVSPIYFDLNGNQTGLKYNQILIEQVGRSRRKIVVLK